MATLGVNIDHVATLRQARGTTYPDVVEAALGVVVGGADHITVHLREDRRHIQDNDLFRLKEVLSVPLNLEMAATSEMVAIASRLQPKRVTIVPERREERTTEAGLDVASGNPFLPRAIARLQQQGIVVSLFIDPSGEQLRASKALGTNAIEIHTGAFCLAADETARKLTLAQVWEVASQGKTMGLGIAAGHGIHYTTLPLLVEAVPEIDEYNIGHAIVARAMIVGLTQAVREIKELMSSSREEKT